MLKVYIQSIDYGFETGITFIEEKHDGKRYIAKPVNLEFVELEAGSNPTLRLSNSTSGEFLKALAEALDKNGIKTESDFKIQGLLEAKNFHLEDMRSLVFKGKK